MYEKNRSLQNTKTTIKLNCNCRRFPRLSIQKIKLLLCVAVLVFSLSLLNITVSVLNEVKDESVETEKTLWLVVCDTRMYKNEHYKYWVWSANEVKRLAIADKSMNVKVKNVCENVIWDGWMTKIETMKSFLTQVIQTGRGSDIIVYADSDSLFNPYAVSAHEMLKRFDEARGSRKILVSAATNCAAGRICSEEMLATIYPEVTERSNCPRFLNAGQFMGSARDLLHLMNEIINFPSNPLMKLANKDKKLIRNDQWRMAVWVSRNKDIATLDYKAGIFRILNFGVIDKDLPGDGTKVCGPGPKCVFGNVTNHVTLDGDGKLNMRNVVGCEAYLQPFNIHGSGPLLKDTILNAGREAMSAGKMKT